MTTILVAVLSVPPWNLAGVGLFASWFLQLVPNSRMQLGFNFHSLGLGGVRSLSPAQDPELLRATLCAVVLDPFLGTVGAVRSCKRWTLGCCHLGSLYVRNAVSEPLNLGTALLLAPSQLPLQLAMGFGFGLGALATHSWNV